MSELRVSKTIIVHGDGPRPKKNQTVSIEYTGWLKDTNKPDQKGAQFDSSVGKGPFEVKIGIGRVIKGWDQAVPEMQVGEKSLLDIPADLAYGDRGFPGIIPPGSDLLFQVELKKIS